VGPSSFSTALNIESDVVGRIPPSELVFCNFDGRDAFRVKTEDEGALTKGFSRRQWGRLVIERRPEKRGQVPGIPNSLAAHRFSAQLQNSINSETTAPSNLRVGCRLLIARTVRLAAMPTPMATIQPRRLLS
jgi:hypothetical protein